MVSNSLESCCQYKRQSVELVQQAAELGEVQAMRDLACIYEHGMGIDVDVEKADFWNDKADAIEAE